MKMLLAVEPGPELSAQVKVALAWTQKMNGTLSLAWVQPPLQSNAPSLRSEDQRQSQWAAIGARHRGTVEEAMSLIPDEHRGDALFLVDEPVEALVEASKDFDVLLAIPGRHQGLERWLEGSVSEALIRRAACPCLLVTDPPVPASRVLLGIDLEDPPSDDTLKSAERFALVLGCRIDLAYIDPYQHPRAVGRGRPLAPDSVLRDRMTACLEGLASWMESFDADVRGETVYESGNLGTFLPLVEMAQKRRPLAVLAASHGRSGFRRAVLGSTAERLVRRSDLPVLVLRWHPSE